METKEEILNNQKNGFDKGQYQSALKAMQEYADQQTESLRDQLQSKETIIAGFKEMVGKLEGENATLKQIEIILKSNNADLEKRLGNTQGANVALANTNIELRISNKSLSARVKQYEDGINKLKNDIEQTDCYECRYIVDELQSLLNSPQGE